MICFTGITAFASSDDTAATVTPSRTISTEGTGHVVDNISDGDKLQFISVTAKDGNVFFVVIDKANTNDNVYTLSRLRAVFCIEQSNDISDCMSMSANNVNRLKFDKIVQNQYNI